MKAELIQREFDSEEEEEEDIEDDVD